MKDQRHGNTTYHGPRRVDRDRPAEVRRVPATSSAYGTSISLNGKDVWGAFDDTGALVAIGATAGQARAAYKRVKQDQQNKGHGAVKILTTEAKKTSATPKFT